MKKWVQFAEMNAYLFDLWKLGGMNPLDPEPETILGTGCDGCLEHIIHEMCHAIDMNLAIGPGVSARISKAIQFRNKLDPDYGHKAEGRAFVIEYHVLRLLRMDHIDIEDITEAASIQYAGESFEEYFAQKDQRLFKGLARCIVKRLETEHRIWIKNERPDRLPKELLARWIPNSRSSTEDASTTPGKSASPEEGTSPSVSASPSERPSPTPNPSSTKPLSAEP